MTNALFYGDNLHVLREEIATESVDLVYLDPPFNSNRSYNVLFEQHGDAAAAQIEAFDDTWAWTPAIQDEYDRLVTGRLANEVADALSVSELFSARPTCWVTSS